MAVLQKMSRRGPERVTQKVRRPAGHLSQQEHVANRRSLHSALF